MRRGSGAAGTSSGARRLGPFPPERPSLRTSSRSSGNCSSFFRRSSTCGAARPPGFMRGFPRWLCGARLMFYSDILWNTSPVWTGPCGPQRMMFASDDCRFECGAPQLSVLTPRQPSVTGTVQALEDG